MKKLLIYLTALVFTNLITAQTTIYKKTIGTKTIELQNDYKLILTNNKGEKIILQEYIKNSMSFGPIGQTMFEIINADIKGNSVYILYYNVGLVDLKVYNFTIDKNFTINSYFIGEETLLSWDNFGDIICFGNMKWINSNLYMYIRAGQNGLETEGLYLLKKGMKKINVIKFSEDIVKITDENKTFQTLDLDTNKEKIITELKRALILNKNIKKNDTVEYLGYFDDDEAQYHNKEHKGRYCGNTFLFFKKNKKIKIARYNHDNFEWLLGYQEEEITYSKKGQKK